MYECRLTVTQQITHIFLRRCLVCLKINHFPKVARDLRLVTNLLVKWFIHFFGGDKTNFLWCDQHSSIENIQILSFTVSLQYFLKTL